MGVPVGEMAALAAASAWAVGSTLFSRIGRDVSPFAMNLWKCLVAGTFLGVTYVLVHGAHLSAPSSSLGWLLASAVAGLTIGDTAYFNAIARLGVTRAILLLSSAPVFAAVGAAIFLNEPLGLRSAIGITVTLAGIGITVSSTRAPQSAPSDETIKSPTASPSTPLDRSLLLGGVAFGLLSGVGQAAGSLLSKHAMRSGLDPLFVASGRLLMGGFALLLISALRGTTFTVARELKKNRAWLRIAGAGFVGSYCGIWFAQIALARTASAGVATTLLATSPAFALPIAHFTSAEPITPRAVLGVVITVGGIALLAF